MSIRWMLLLSAAAIGVYLGPRGVAAGGRRLSSLPPVPDPGPCVPPRSKSAPVGLHGYRRYFANDSLIGRPVPCTREDKICFRHNLIFNTAENICDKIGGGHDDQCDLRPHRTQFQHGSGRIIGVCKTYEDPCPGYRMAYDGRCYRKEVVRDVICGCGAKPTRHFLEGVECRSSPATPVHIQQPGDEGRCLIPDLRFPDFERSQFFRNPFTEFQGFQGTRTGISFRVNNPILRCNSNQAKCFAQEKVWVSGARGCYQLFEKGPCPQGHVVALNIDLAVKGRAEATCVEERGGCPRGHKRMLFDGRCHENREISIEAPGKIVRNQYGQYVLIPHGFSIFFRPIKVNNACQIDNSAVGPGISERRPDPPCGANNQGQCKLYEVEAEAPLPEL